MATTNALVIVVDRKGTFSFGVLERLNTVFFSKSFGLTILVRFHRTFGKNARFAPKRRYNFPKPFGFFLFIFMFSIPFQAVVALKIGLRFVLYVDWSFGGWLPIPTQKNSHTSLQLRRRRGKF